MEFLTDGNGHHDDDCDVGVAKYECVCDGWDEDGGVQGKVEVGEEGCESEGGGVDTADFEGIGP